MGLNESQKMDRSEYLENNLIITEYTQKVPYAFISYASDNWETVFKNAVVPMQKEYGLRVFADKAFDRVNDMWIVPMLRNIRGSDVMVAFVSQSYIESYACFLELLTAVNSKKQIVFVFLEQPQHRRDANALPNVERGVKIEILKQGANIATNTDDSSNDVMRAMKSAYTSISTLLEQDKLSKFDITEAFIIFFENASINRKTINDLDAVKRTINSVSGDVFDKPPITKSEPVVQQPETEYQPVPQAAEAAARSVPETPKGIAAKLKIDLHSKKCKTMIAAAAVVCCIVVGGIVIGLNSPKDVTDKPYANDMLKVGSVYGEVTGTYTGRWQKDRPEGEGTLTFSNGSVYSGEWKGGKANGQGTLTFASGDLYEGEYKENRRDGHGVYTWADGDVYEGEWKDGMRNGQGVYTWTDGSVYEGEWKDDKREGHGVKTFGEGTDYAGDVYEGEWKDGMYNGHGVYTWADGRVYTGQWTDDKRDGLGTMTYLDGSVYEGEWKDDKREGHGVKTFGEGTDYADDVYEGEWKDGRFNGQGVYTWADGQVYDGEFKDDVRTGEGTMTYADGTVKTGMWEDGQYVGTAFNAPANFTAVIDPDNSTGVMLEWKAVRGATGYQTRLYKDAEHKEIWIGEDDDALTEDLYESWSPMEDGQTYYFGVRAAKEKNGKTTYSDWSYVDYTHNPS